jgi:hypothetical protein
MIIITVRSEVIPVKKAVVYLDQCPYLPEMSFASELIMVHSFSSAYIKIKVESVLLLLTNDFL